MKRQKVLGAVKYERLLREVSYMLEGSCESYLTQIEEASKGLAKCLPVTRNTAIEGITRARAEEIIDVVMKHAGAA